MCWITNKKEHTEELITQEDIKTIKFLGITPKCTILLSPFKLYRYNLNMPMPSIELIPEIVEHGRIRIRKGYHSYAYPEKIALTNNNDITKVCYELIFEGSHLPIELPKYPFMPLSYSPYECVIPKGTKYYINECDEIVSETIIIKKPHDIIFPSQNLNSKAITAYKALVGWMIELSTKIN